MVTTALHHRQVMNLAQRDLLDLAAQVLMVVDTMARDLTATDSTVKTTLSVVQDHTAVSMAPTAQDHTVVSMDITVQDRTAANMDVTARRLLHQVTNLPDLKTLT